MKRGPSAEVLSGTSQPTKKAKIDDVLPTTTTTVNGVQGTTVNQEGWTKVEKRKKKKEVKVDWKRDVRFVFVTTSQPGPCSSCNHVANHHHHPCTDYESAVYVFES
jgi:hypothetical protein